MASEAQIQANRANARKSTGPRTEAGKAAVAQNAVKHGLRAEQMVIKGEDPGEFESYREQMLDELCPDGALESMLAERAVGLAWRLRRAERLHVEAFDALLDEYENDRMRKYDRSMRLNGAGAGASALGQVVTRDFGYAQVLYRLGMYERRIEHSLYKTLNELRKHRLLREVDEREEDHRQASLDAATPTPEPPAPPAETQPRQTKPISRAGSTETPVSSRATADKEPFLLDNTCLSGYDPALAPAGRRPIRHGTRCSG